MCTVIAMIIRIENQLNMHNYDIYNNSCICSGIVMIVHSLLSSKLCRHVSKDGPARDIKDDN